MKAIGPYRICERLDAGGRVPVHRAVCFRDGRQVVVTIVPRIIAAQWPSWDDPRRVRFLVHPNILRLLDVAETPEHVALVHEYVDGEDLRRFLLRRRLPLGSALFIAAELCRALAAAHDAIGPDGEGFAFYHGWLCPRCVLVSKQGGVKLRGFGTSRARVDDERPPEEPMSEALSYLAPEQVRARGGGARTDVFLVGVVLHEMIADARPFFEYTKDRLLRALQEGRRTSLTSRELAAAKHLGAPPSALLEAIDGLLGWTLSTNPEDRPASAAALLEAIESLARRFQLPLGPPSWEVTTASG